MKDVSKIVMTPEQKNIYTLGQMSGYEQGFEDCKNVIETCNTKKAVSKLIVKQK